MFNKLLSIFGSFLLSFVLCMTSSSNAHAAKMVKLETSMGNIVIELYEDKAPATVANFLKYVNDGFYDGLIFHRVIKSFMIQAGGFTPNMQQKTTTYPPIKNEANNGLPNSRYSVSMARTSDPHSATAQFFINTKDNGFLNYTAPTEKGWGYTVFGKVIEGQDIVNAIENVKTTRAAGHSDVPSSPVVIEKAEVIETPIATIQDMTKLLAENEQVMMQPTQPIELKSGSMSHQAHYQDATPLQAENIPVMENIELVPAPISVAEPTRRINLKLTLDTQESR